MIMEYTQDKYRDMLLTPGICNSRHGTAAWEYALCHPGRHHPDAHVFRQLEQHFCEIGSVTPMAHLNAGHLQMIWTPANENTIIAVME
jgi:hypothetical protein